MTGAAARTLALPHSVDVADAPSIAIISGAKNTETERTPRSMQEQLTDGDEATATIGDTIVDPTAEHAYQQVLDAFEIRDVHDLTEQLDERERTVIRAHYGLGQDARTLSEIGAGLGLTAERARQIEAAALSKLRAALSQSAPVR